MKKLPIILTSIVAVFLLGIVIILGVKFKNNSTDTLDIQEHTTFNERQNSQTDVPFEYEESSVLSFLETETTDETRESTSDFSTDISKTVNNTATSVSQVITEISTTVATTVATTIAKINTEFNKVFTLPKAPKYVPHDVDIDFNKASLASYKYDPVGNYYYTDDKDSWQRNFGYSEVYDKAAPITAMFFDTVRNTFSYDGKDWMIQMWKGQYGYYFVGGEIGVYTKKAGSNSKSYVCADKNDWLKMEMTFMWDEDKTGNYQPIFTRPYTEYWWCTGFVIGFEMSASRRSREQFRIVAHITFKDNQMAELFCESMVKNGFREVSFMDKDVVDTFVRVGNDVGFVWQNINQHVI